MEMMEVAQRRRHSTVIAGCCCRRRRVEWTVVGSSVWGLDEGL